jgi:hypothetical protein
MHRSGTSALTRVLNLLGCDLPATLLQADPTNEAGHWESHPIVRLNDRILQSAGTNWHDWQEFYPGWLKSPKADQFREEGLNLLASEFNTSHLFVLKDPRLCRILPFWLEVFRNAGVRPLILSPLRNPLEVAASLAKRNGFDPSFGTLLWLRNVLAAEFASRGKPRLFAPYTGLKANWRTLVRRMESRFDIVWPRRPDKAASEINAFLSDDLQHHRVAADAIFSDPSISEWLASTFQVLSGWAEKGERRADFAILDRIRTEFATASPAISQLVIAEQATKRIARRSVAELEQLRDRLAKSDAELAGETQRAQDFERELETIRSSLAEKEQRIGALANELMLQTKAAEAAQANLAEAHIRVHQGEAFSESEHVAALEQQLAALRSALEEKDKRIAALANDRVLYADAGLQIAGSDDSGLSVLAEQLQLELQVAKDELRLKDGEIAALASELERQVRTLEGELLNEARRAKHFEEEFGKARDILAENERRLETLFDEVRSHALARDKAETALADALSRLAQTESALVQRRHEADQTAEELARAQAQLKEMTAATAENEKIIAGLKEHAHLLLTDFKDRQVQIEILEKKTREQYEEIGELQNRQKEQINETVRLSRLALEREQETQSLREVAAKELGRSVVGLIGKRKWPLLPRRLRLKQQMALLERSGLFDREWYLQRYEDVRQSGIDPLRHYAEHGAREGREPNSKFERPKK